jgi:hypothetical protein
MRIPEGADRLDLSELDGGNFASRLQDAVEAVAEGRTVWVSEGGEAPCAALVPAEVALAHAQQQERRTYPLLWPGGGTGTVADAADVLTGAARRILDDHPEGTPAYDFWRLTVASYRSAAKRARAGVLMSPRETQEFHRQLAAAGHYLAGAGEAAKS